MAGFAVNAAMDFPALALAPMAGVTEWPMRLLCREQGCAYAVTEMVSAKGFLRMPAQSPALAALLRREAVPGPLAVQIFGHEPSECAEAARQLADMGFDAVDINMGCPAPKITRSGEGSALLKDLPRAAAIVRAVVHAAPVPVTVKMRIGWDAESVCAVPFALMAQAEGAAALAVHGRTRELGYAGRADWDTIGAVKAAVEIPVWGNGDVFSAKDALALRAAAGCDGVMVGRGALGNPWIFAQIRAGQENPPAAAERADMALRHARMQCAWKGEAVGMREMRKHVCWYFKGLPGAARLRGRLQALARFSELEDVIQAFLD